MPVFVFLLLQYESFHTVFPHRKVCRTASSGKCRFWRFLVIDFLQPSKICYSSGSAAVSWVSAAVSVSATVSWVSSAVSPSSVVVLGNFCRFLFPFPTVTDPDPRFFPDFQRFFRCPFGLFLLKKFLWYVIIMVLHGTLFGGILWHTF